MQTVGKGLQLPKKLHMISPDSLKRAAAAALQMPLLCMDDLSAAYKPTVVFLLIAGNHASFHDPASLIQYGHSRSLFLK